MSSMDPELHEAARKGDINFLIGALSQHSPDYFLTQQGSDRNIFHIAAWNERVEFIKEAIQRLPKHILNQLLFQKNENGRTPLHRAAVERSLEIIHLIVDYYNSMPNDEAGKPSKPWLALTEYNDTPLHLVLKEEDSKGDEQIAMELLSLDVELLSNMVDWDGNSPLFLAFLNGYSQVAEKILSIDPTTCQILNKLGESIFFTAVRLVFEEAVEEILRNWEPRYYMLRRHDGTTVLHYLHLWPEKTGTRLLEKYWWMINLADDNNLTPLDKAKENNTRWAINLLTNPSLISEEPFDWITACKREETPAILAFIDTCYDLERIFREQNDTPLHHIKLPTYKAYQDFLKIPSIAELKNTTDHDGSTPLHRAVERKDMLLSKALLLDNGVERTISNNNGTTAMDLLAHLYKENDDWEKMCKQITVNPFIKTTYIQHGTNLEQIRTTLSVVAALLATITFAAAFTLPGGINSSTGEALLAKKAAFLVFLLADVVAMCTSMLVLFFLIWSMVSKPDTARLLVDRSVYILLLSLLSTLLAFMTGIYTVIHHSSLWAVILVIVMCSLIAILASCTILYKEFAKLIPAARTPKKDRLRLLEEGGVAPSSTGNDASNKTD